MFQKLRSPRCRNLRPAVDSLEERALLNGSLPFLGPNITILNEVVSHGYLFINLNGPAAGTTAGTGTNLNGISNTGAAVGFSIENNGDLLNFVTQPLRSRAAKVLNINGSTTAMAFGINSSGVVVGTDGKGDAFFLTRRGRLVTFIPPGGLSATAFGINDRGMIAGQYVTATATPGFLLVHGGTEFITINAPSGPNVVNAQGVNNHGLVVGFYVTNGQDHGFVANAHAAINRELTGTAIADPVIPAVSGEPGATFVFSQVLGVNDRGIAVGYYGDSTTSQHGYFYNTHTGTYRFLDDPNAAFNNGVEVTQITGIANSGEITGFYSDAQGVFHGFVAIPV